MKKYPCDLVPDGKVIVSLNAGHTGLGAGSCGPPTLEQYRLKSGLYNFRYRIQPYEGVIDAFVRQRFQMPDLTKVEVEEQKTLRLKNNMLSYIVNSFGEELETPL